MLPALVCKSRAQPVLKFETDLPDTNKMPPTEIVRPETNTANSHWFEL